jgi:hypothetical protein
MRTIDDLVYVIEIKQIVRLVNALADIAQERAPA